MMTALLGDPHIENSGNAVAIEWRGRKVMKSSIVVIMKISSSPQLFSMNIGVGARTIINIEQNREASSIIYLIMSEQLCIQRRSRKIRKKEKYDKSTDAWKREEKSKGNIRPLSWKCGDAWRRFETISKMGGMVLPSSPADIHLTMKYNYDAFGCPSASNAKCFITL